MADDPRLDAVALARMTARFDQDPAELSPSLRERMIAAGRREARMFLAEFDAAMRFPPPAAERHRAALDPKERDA
jgi:hypothetical protein